MDIEKIYSDFSVVIADSSDKHFRDGWINTSCPFCTGNPGFHLGFNVFGDYFYCWRCGKKPTIKALSKILGVSFDEAKKICKQYKGKSKIGNTQIRVKKLEFKFPSLCIPVTENPLSMRYLMDRRGFSKRDILKLQKKFSLVATKFGSQFDNMDLSYRIIAPIIFKGKVVSWQSRDMTGKSALKYLTCPKNRETMDHKTLLYNELIPSGTILVVEGIFDVWKCYLAGFRAVSTFGVEYTYPQLNRLLSYENILIFMDPDRAGRKHAAELKNRLIFGGRQSTIIKHGLDKDPGGMTINEIKGIVEPYFKL